MRQTVGCSDLLYSRGAQPRSIGLGFALSKVVIACLLHILGEDDRGYLLLISVDIALQYTYEALEVVRSHNHAALHLGSLRTREEADEVEDEFALRVHHDSEVAVHAVSELLRDLDVEALVVLV